MNALPTQDRRRLIHKLRNWLQSAVLIAGMAAIAGGCAWTLWGTSGLIWTFLGVALGLALSPSVPPELVMNIYRAAPLDEDDFPAGYALVRALAERAELPALPRLYLVPSTILNAFAVGRPNHAAIAVTDALLRALSGRELASILAHEISHVRHDDLRIMSLADTMSRLTGFVSYFGMLLLMVNLPLLIATGHGIPWLLIGLLIFAPTVMSLLQLALSRAREFDADLDAVGLTGDPEGLISALDKLERYQGRLWEEILFPGRRIPEPSLLRTHPPTEERIRRLRDLAPRQRQPVLEELPESAGLGPGRRIVSGRPRWHWPGLWY